MPNLMESMGLTPKTENQEIEMIGVKHLHENPDNFYTVGDLTELKDAILLAGGVKQNLIVKHYHHNEYMIVAGHRRFKAVMELIQAGEKIAHELPCIVESDEKLADLLLITTNSTNRKLTDWERVQQFQKLEAILDDWKRDQAMPTTKRELLSQMLGESRTNVARLQAINNNLIEGLKDELHNGSIGISAAYEASKFDAAEQQYILMSCKRYGGVSLGDIGDAVADYRAENNMPPSTVHIDAPPQHVEINVDLAEGEHFPDNPPTSEDITIDTLERLDELEPSDCGEYGVFKQYATVLICQDRRRTVRTYIALDKTEGFYFGVNYQMYSYGGVMGPGKINAQSYTTWKLALHAAIVYLIKIIEGKNEDDFCRKMCKKWSDVFDDLWKEYESIKRNMHPKINEDIENNTVHTITEKSIPKPPTMILVSKDRLKQMIALLPYGQCCPYNNCPQIHQDVVDCTACRLNYIEKAD